MNDEVEDTQATCRERPLIVQQEETVQQDRTALTRQESPSAGARMVVRPYRREVKADDILRLVTDQVARVLEALHGLGIAPGDPRQENIVGRAHQPQQGLRERLRSPLTFPGLPSTVFAIAHAIPGSECRRRWQQFHEQQRCQASGLA
jgi:hypothetical protein